MKYFFLIILTQFLLIANANSQIIDSSFYSWTVYEMQEDELDEKKCYIVSNPVKSDTDSLYRQTPYIMISRYQNRRVEEFSVNSGFEYKKNAKILVLVDNKKFNLLSNNNMAWMPNKDEDARIIQEILYGAKIKVRGDSSAGFFAVDEYSLKGIAKAYSRMRRICD